MPKNLLITGGAGFIGVNAALHFRQQGWNVTLFDNLSRRGTDFNVQMLKEKAPEVRLERGDVRTDTQKMQALMEENDAVLHLAAQVAVTTSVTDPRNDFDNNALGTFNVLEAVRLSKRKPMLIYASTNKVYGGLETCPVEEGETRYSFTGGRKGVTEDQPLDFHSPYGCSKGAADQYVRDYARLYGLRTVVFRQSCIYGPNQFGVEDQGWVAWFLIAGLMKRPVTVYGNGKQVRDLLNVSDLVRAYELALTNPEKVSGEIFNLGGGHTNTLSLLEFLEMMKTELGLPLSYTFSDWRAGDQPMFVSDNTKMETVTGWKPEMEVKRGITELAAWLKERKGMIEKFYS